MSYCIAQKCKDTGQCAPRLQHSLSCRNSLQVPGDGMFNLSNSLTFPKNAESTLKKANLRTILLKFHRNPGAKITMITSILN